MITRHRNLAQIRTLQYYRQQQGKPEAAGKTIVGLRQFSSEVLFMATQSATQEGFEMSLGFRKAIQERIVQLERDANGDEAQLDRLNDIDHVRRQMRLVAVQRAEALRLRIFLDRADAGISRPVRQVLRNPFQTITNNLIHRSAGFHNRAQFRFDRTLRPLRRRVALC